MFKRCSRAVCDSVAENCWSPGEDETDVPWVDQSRWMSVGAMHGCRWRPPDVTVWMTYECWLTPSANAMTLTPFLPPVCTQKYFVAWAARGCLQESIRRDEQVHEAGWLTMWRKRVKLTLYRGRVNVACRSPRELRGWRNTAVPGRSFRTYWPWVRSPVSSSAPSRWWSNSLPERQELPEILKFTEKQLINSIYIMVT